MFYYCPQCGLISSSPAKNCPVCDYSLKTVPVTYLSASGNMFCSSDARNAFIQEVIEAGSEYQPDLAQQRNAILEEKKKSREKVVEELAAEYRETKPTHRCPVCSSQNLTKISNAGKVAKIALIGVWGAGDLGKQWRCNSCGYKF